MPMQDSVLHQTFSTSVSMPMQDSVLHQTFYDNMINYPLSKELKLLGNGEFNYLTIILRFLILIKLILQTSCFLRA